MPNDPTPALLYRMNQNVMALGSTIEEIGIWIDQRGSTNAFDRINAHLQAPEGNSDAITDLMIDLMAKWGEAGKESAPED